MSFALRLSFFSAVTVWALKATAGMAVILGALWVAIAGVTVLTRRLRRAISRW